jgi:hypothetical protein
VNKLSRIAAFSTAIALSAVSNGLFLSPAVAQVVALNSAQVTKLEGTAGGNQKDSGCAGFIPESPNHQVQVGQDSNLRFLMEGSEDATLLIVGAKNQRFCVQADKVSKGKAEIPGRWSRGNYDVFVGTRNKTRSAYTLTIEPL